MRSPHDATFGFGPKPTIEQARQEFLAACDRSGDGPPPDLVVFLVAFDEPERSSLRVELEKILSERWGGSRYAMATRSEGSLETQQIVVERKKAPPAGDGVVGDESDETIDRGPDSNDTIDRVVASEDAGEYLKAFDETIERPAALGPMDESVVDSDATVDHAPATDGARKIVSPDATIDHQSGAAGNADFSLNPDTTIEHTSATDRNGVISLNPDTTIDHQAAAAGKGGFSLNPDATIDHATEPYITGEYVSSETGSKADTQPMKQTKAQLPATVAGYEIISVLGRGAMGVVYKARQRGLKRIVALKMILSGEHAGEQELARFQAEANAVAQLQHPGIIQIYEVGEDESRPFFSLEFVDGVSLQKKLQANPLSPKEAAALLKQMADAMAYAHQRGVIHRDLKPANVLLTSDGIPKIGDFGLAKRLEDDESGLTRTGTVLGTPSYMPPEQASGFNDQVGPLADVYSLGAILYDMLTGRPPFKGTSVMDTIQQLRTREPVPPMQLQPSVPRDLETICLKCLEKDRFKRYADAAALAADVQNFLEGRPILARPISKVEHAWRWCRRNPSLSIPMAVGLLMLFSWAASVTALAFKLDDKNEKIANSYNDLDAKKTKIEEQKVDLDKKNTALTNSYIALDITNKAEVKARDEATANLKKSEAEANGQRRVAQLGLELNSRMMQKVNNILKSRRLFASAPDEFKKLRAQVLADMRQTLQEYAKQMTDKAVSVFTDALVNQIMGDLLMKMGEIKEPRELFIKGRNSVAAIAAANPNHDLSRANLAVMDRKLGDLALDMEGNARLAEEQFRISLALNLEILEHPRDDSVPPIERKRNVAHDDIRIGRALIAQGRSTESHKFFDEAFTYYSAWNDDEMKGKKLGEPRSYMMQTMMLLGTAAGNRGDFPAGEAHFKSAFELVRNLQENFPTFIDYKHDYAEAEGAYGDLLFRQGKLEDAFAHYTKAHQYMWEWFGKYPDDTAQQTLMALTLERMGLVAQALKKPMEAKPFLEEAKLLREELFNVERGNYSRQANLVLAMARIRDFATAMPNCNGIRPRMLKSTEPMLQLARCHAVCARDGGPDRAGNIKLALSALAIAAGGDYQDAPVLETDPDLSVLYNEPAFKELMTKIKTRAKVVSK